jgi:hypothetical protein
MYWQYQIPEPEPGQLMIPINLTYSNDVWLLILKLKKLLYLMLDLKKLVEKSLIRTQRNDTRLHQTDPGWSGRGCWRDPGPRTRVGLQLTMRSKETEEY